MIIIFNVFLDIAAYVEVVFNDRPNGTAVTPVLMASRRTN